MQERIILILGAVNWILGGVVCWAFEGIQIESVPPPPEHHQAPPDDTGKEWHSASDFVQPGSRKSLLPPKYCPRRVSCGAGYSAALLQQALVPPNMSRPEGGCWLIARPRLQLDFFEPT